MFYSPYTYLHDVKTSLPPLFSIIAKSCSALARDCASSRAFTYKHVCIYIRMYTYIYTYIHTNSSYIHDQATYEYMFVSKHLQTICIHMYTSYTYEYIHTSRCL